MKPDEELKDAREWLDRKKWFTDRVLLMYESELSEITNLLDSYHHHMLDKAWVRCADRLPEKSGMYNVNVAKSGILISGVHSCFFNSENKLWIDGNDKRKKSMLHDYIVDWQSLPEPPKEMK